MRCPVCNAPYRRQRLCTRCGVDLQPILEAGNRAVAAYNDAVNAARHAAWPEALQMIDRAIGYAHDRAVFFTLRGKIHAHLHRYPDALRDWRTARSIDPDCGADRLIAALGELVTVAGRPGLTPAPATSEPSSRPDLR